MKEGEENETTSKQAYQFISSFFVFFNILFPFLFLFLFSCFLVFLLSLHISISLFLPSSLPPLPQENPLLIALTVAEGALTAERDRALGPEGSKRAAALRSFCSKVSLSCQNV